MRKLLLLTVLPLGLCFSLMARAEEAPVTTPANDTVSNENPSANVEDSRWGHYRGGWGYRGYRGYYGYRGWGYRGWGYRGYGYGRWGYYRPGYWGYGYRGYYPGVGIGIGVGGIGIGVGTGWGYGYGGYYCGRYVVSCARYRGYHGRWYRSCRRVCAGAYYGWYNNDNSQTQTAAPELSAQEAQLPVASVPAAELAERYNISYEAAEKMATQMDSEAAQAIANGQMPSNDVVDRMSSQLDMDPAATQNMLGDMLKQPAADQTNP